MVGMVVALYFPVDGFGADGGRSGAGCVFEDLDTPGNAVGNKQLQSVFAGGEPEPGIYGAAPEDP